VLQFVAIVAAVLALGAPAFADVPGEVEVYGTVEAVVTTAPMSITVAGVTLAVDATTLLFDQTHTPVAAFTDPPFTVGTTVEVQGVQLAGGGTQATEIQLETALQLQDVDLRGAIDTIGTSSFTVAGLTIVVDANTAIIGTTDLPATFADLAVGMIVEIQGNTQADGSILATRVKIEDATDVTSVDVQARVDGLGDTFIVEANERFIVTPLTQFFGRRDAVISFAELHRGDLAAIQGVIRNGALVAEKVRANITAAVGLHAIGVLRGKTATSITVAGRVYKVPRGTEILSRTGMHMRMSGLKVGMTVTIEYVRFGTIRVAREIKVM
jgi:hypothetical protein